MVAAINLVFAAVALVNSPRWQQARAPLVTRTARWTPRAAAVVSTGAEPRPNHFRFVSPLYEDGYLPQPSRPELPYLLYLPGFDGTLVSPFLQFPKLGENYDVQGFNIPMSDRSTLVELVSVVVARIEEELPRRKVYIIGESFGGILALSVALVLKTRKQKLAGLTLVNPATCYLESALFKRAGPVSNLPRWLYPLGVLTLLPLFVDKHGLAQLAKLVTGKKLPQVIDTPAREAYMGRVALTLYRRIKFMPRATLKWRLLEWLTEGATRLRVAQTELSKLDVPTLILVGEDDRTLPSAEEADRLSGILPDVKVQVVDGAGHASTCGSRVDLARALNARFAPTRGRFGKGGAVANAGGLMIAATPGSTDVGLMDRPHPIVQPRDYWASSYYFPPETRTN